MGYVGKDRRDLSQHQTIYETDDDSARAALRRHESRRTVEVVAGGTSIEALGGVAAVVLAVIGLTSYAPRKLAASATIAIAAALLVQGGSVAARWRDALRRADGIRYDRSELISGIGTEIFGGLVGVVLGVIALAGVLPEVLLPTAAIVFGGALLLGGAAHPELADLAPGAAARRPRVTQDAVLASSGVMVTVGIAAAVLGILGLLAVGPVLTLALVALLCIGGAMAFGGSALTARLLDRRR